MRDSVVLTHFLKIWYATVLKWQISYGFEEWFTDLKSRGLRRLSSCQRICLLTIIRGYRSISTEALCVLAGELPIDIELSNSSYLYSILHGDGSVEIDNNVTNYSDISRCLPTFSYPNYYEKHSKIILLPM